MSGAARAAGLCISSLLVGACAEEEGLRVVGTGRYIELATDQNEPVCAGTVAFYDRLIDEAFAFLGEPPPDRVFLRYEWVDLGTDSPLFSGLARLEGDDVVIRASALVHEHELAHAVHLEAWPHSARFLHEGLAVVLDPRSPISQQPADWTQGFPLDELLGATEPTTDVYFYGWFLVSQLLADHGVVGLRALWHAVPSDASAQEVRDAYESLFGRPIEALIQPWEFEDEGHPLDGSMMERSACTMVLCPGETIPWAEDVWSAIGPVGCEDDPGAVGPYGFPLVTYSGQVWREYVLDTDGAEIEADPANDPERSEALPCGFTCSAPPAFFFGQGAPLDEPWRTDVGRLRLVVTEELDALPTMQPTTIHYRRVPE